MFNIEVQKEVNNWRRKAPGKNITKNEMEEARHENSMESEMSDWDSDERRQKTSFW